MEIWKTIEGFENYEISSWGNVRNKCHNYFFALEPSQTSKGYLVVGLYKNGKGHRKKVHRLVAEAFIPNPYNLPQVNHIDGNKQNNSYTNLEWVTDEMNKSHARRMRALANETDSSCR